MNRSQLQHWNKVYMKNIKKTVLLLFALTVVAAVHAVDGIEEDITPINTLMADVIVKINSQRVDEAVNAIFRFPAGHFVGNRRPSSRL